jgi:transposase
MANRLSMADIHSIQLLSSMHWSQRRIARVLGIDRETVRKYLACGSCDPKPAISPSGSAGSKPATFPGSPGPGGGEFGGAGSDDPEGGPKPAISPSGSDANPGAASSADSASSPLIESGPPTAPTSIPGHRESAATGRPSACTVYRELIEAKLEAGLTAQRIYQDLVAEHGFPAGYDSVKRFVRKLGSTHALPMRRMECLPGAEAQVDFGTGAPVIGPDGKRRKTHVFRIVLSHSRKGYSEATFRQTTDDFLHCLENAFAHFGGVPQTLVIDNLRAAVLHPDWFDPELVPRLRAFCEHYQVSVLPTRPYLPRHKGKVERGVAYVQSNALKARSFDSLDAQNRHLAEWERTVADTRIHGTTRRQVEQAFAGSERAALRPLPQERFPFFHEARRIVNRDGHIEVAKAYYSVPPEYLSRTVWVRWDTRLVRIFNQRFEQIALHVRHEQGRFSTQGQHLAREKISGLERGTQYLLSRVSLIGAHTRQWAEAMVTARGIEGTRVLMGVLSLAKKHPPETLENACRTALSHGAYQLRAVRQLLTRQECSQPSLPFLETHPLIRPLDDYASVVAAALARKESRSDHERRAAQSPAAPEGFLRHGEGVPYRRNEQRPGGVGRQGVTASGTRPRSGDPLPGCTPAEPDSVSPDPFSLFPFPTPQQE